jgi:hypothetical protein
MAAFLNFESAWILPSAARANRCGDFPVISFDFLGFQFRARKAMRVKRVLAAPGGKIPQGDSTQGLGKHQGAACVFCIGYVMRSLSLFWQNRR